MKEIWMRIYGYPKYEVNNSGEVRNIRTKRAASMLYFRRDDDLKVQICNSYNEYKWVSVKRIVAESFLGGPHDDCDVDFIDGDPENFAPENLRWIDWKHTKKALKSMQELDGLKIMVVETGEEFDSIYECSKKLGVTQKAVRRCLGNPSFICKAHCHLRLVE